MLAALALLGALAAPAEPGPAVVSVSVAEPRGFGYFIGDVLTRTVIVDAPSGMALEPGSLPQAGPLNYWLDLRAVAVERFARAPGIGYRIALTYQTFYAPLDPRRLTIPGFTLKLSDGGRTEEARIAPFDFVTSPVRELFADSQSKGNSVALQADARPLPVPVRKSRDMTIAAGAALLLSAALLAWHYAWGPFRRRPKRPFTRAAYFLRSNGPELAGEGGYRAALLKLHRAFDVAAGRRVLSNDLQAFLSEHPQFSALGPDIDRLFATSRQAFFANDVARARANMPLADLTVLAVRLAAVERRAV